MSNYAEYVRKDRRLAILRLLAEADGYSLNSSILRDLLEGRCGHRVSRDVVDTELDWLAEQGLVDVENLEIVRVASITRRGDDVAHGRAKATGVKRPSPGA